MDKKTICFIRQTSIYNDSRATKTIKSLLHSGYKVIVLGWDREGDAQEKTKKVFENDDISLFFYNKQLQHGAGLKGIIKLLGFIGWVNKMVKKYFKEINYIHACDLDAAIGCFNFAKRKKIPFVYDVYDYYVEAHTVPNMVKNFVEQKEIDIINNSDCVIICSEPRIKQIIKAKPKKIEVIHNSPNITIQERENSENKKIKLVFIGALAKGRLIEEVLCSAEKYKEVELIIGGMGEYAQLAEQYSQTHDNIKYYGVLSYDNVLKIEQESDILFATYDPDIPNHKYSAPNKLYEAMALGKPIIVCKGTCVDELVVQEDIGKAINYNADELFNCALEIMKDKEWLKDVKKRGQSLYKEKYSWDIMAKRLETIYKELQ